MNGLSVDTIPGIRLARAGATESVEEAALREAREEIGVSQDLVDILGRLTPLPIAVSGHLLNPVVGIATARPVFTLAMKEVDRLIEAPIERHCSIRHRGVGRTRPARCRRNDASALLRSRWGHRSGVPPR